jgi:hypothetical protein
MSDSDQVQDESLAGQRLRLASLEECEVRLRRLRERECELEVEHMAAEAALQSAANRVQQKIDPALALRLGRVLERRLAREQRSSDNHEERGLRSSGSARQRDQLRAGSAALRAWLDASRPHEPGAIAVAAKIALLVATIATLWAAYAIHPAFLLLLVVVVGPVSFAMGRGHDSEWRRLGARRHFAASGLADLGEWNDESVRRRLGELEELLARAHTGGAGLESSRGTNNEFEEDNLAEEDEQFASDLAAAGLTVEDTRGDTGEWLHLLARAERRRESLDLVKSERARVREQAAELRDHLLRYLQSQGVRPTQLPDTTAAISEDLERLSDVG